MQLQCRLGGDKQPWPRRGAGEQCASARLLASPSLWDKPPGFPSEQRGPDLGQGYAGAGGQVATPPEGHQRSSTTLLMFTHRVGCDSGNQDQRQGQEGWKVGGAGRGRGVREGGIQVRTGETGQLSSGWGGRRGHLLCMPTSWGPSRPPNANPRNAGDSRLPGGTFDQQA